MKFLLSSFLFTFISLTATTQDITGSWQGFIPIGDKKIRLLFSISKTNSDYMSTMDSPDQNAYGIKCSKTMVTPDSLILGIEIIKGGFQGKRVSPDEIEGMLIQGPGRMSLTLKRLRIEDIPKSEAFKEKPQTPKPPYNYSVEDVVYENSVQKITLGATLTKPTGNEKFPVVLMITGSGMQDRDESIGMDKPFFVIANYLTSRGIGVLRIDDRGVGKSSGNFIESTSADFATDVMAGIQYLKTRKDIDTLKIGLLGHSEGGFIAPYVAARTKDVAFIVLLAGPAVGGTKTMYFQAVEKPLANVPEHDRIAYGELYTKMLEIAKNDQVSQDVPNYIRNTYLAWKKEQPDSTLKTLVHGSDEVVIKSFITGFSDLKRLWWRFFLNYDISVDLEKLSIPVLALNGERDEQVDSKANLTLINHILTKNKNPQFKVMEVPGLNHLFQHCTSCGSVSEYLDLTETFDIGTLAIINNWIQERVK